MTTKKGEEDMSDIEYNRIKFVRAYLPALVSGIYTVSLEQRITSPVQERLPAVNASFRVETPAFTLRKNAVFSVFPGENSAGEYADTLPHIVFSDKTYLWERRIDGCGTKDRKENVWERKDTTPWMALICLNSKEDFSLEHMTIREALEQKKDKVYMPPYQFDPGTGEKETDPCMVLEVSKALYKEVFPRQEELAYLAHGRQVDLHDCADNIIPMDGCFSVLTANRFPVSSEEPGEKTGVFLISLEGYDGLLPADREGEEPLSDYERLRFICLYTWSFQSVKDGFIGFRQALEHMDVRALSLSEERPDELPGLLKRGYVPLKHITRTGETCVSVYRGPLVPMRQPAEERRDCLTADGEIRYDPEWGIFDLSYSGAWQLGRLLTLRNRSMAKAVFHWRREVKKQRITRQNRLLLAQKFRMAAEQDRCLREHDTVQSGKQDTDKTVQEQFMDYWVSGLGQMLSQGALLGSAADPTGRKRLENME